MRIVNSVLIVTGATSGIGAATARELARRGAKVVLAARRADTLSVVTSDIIRRGDTALGIPTDLRSRHSIDALVAQTVRTYGRVDGVVNVAEIGAAELVVLAGDEGLERTVAINLLAPARLVQAALPYMRHDGSAAIVNIGATAWEASTNGMYSATKLAMRALSDSLHRELCTKRIAVSLVEPGHMHPAAAHRVPGAALGPELVARAVAAVLECPRRALVVLPSWRLMRFCVRHLQIAAERLFARDRGPVRLRLVDAGGGTSVQR